MNIKLKYMLESGNRRISISFGTKVHYIDGAGKIHNGKVKDYVQSKIITEIFVVYDCAGEWQNFQNYTGVRTKIEDLHPGWVKKIDFRIKKTNT